MKLPNSMSKFAYLSLPTLLFSCYTKAAPMVTGNEVNALTNSIIKTLSEAEKKGSWPAGYCEKTYSDIAEISNKAYSLSKETNNTAEITENFRQLNKQAEAMLKLCGDFDNNTFPGGQLQTRYLRADMSLWKAQFDMLFNNNPTPLSKINIVRSNSAKPAEKLKDFQKFRDCEDFYCSQMVVLPKGNYLMGGTPEEHLALNVDKYRADWESPRHAVQIGNAFAISTTEVTVQDFAQFVQETKREMAAGCLAFPGYPAMSNREYAIYQPNLSWENPGFEQSAMSPVTCVTRTDAEDYAIWLSAKTGVHYRLPSEAEWEYAARAGTNTPYFWGNKVEDGCNYATFYDESTDKATGFRFIMAKCDDKTPYTATVANFKPNNWGIYDITGNVREWVSDAWESSYETGPYTEAPRKTGVSQFPVLRGGAWNYMPQNVRIAYRSAYYSWPMRANMWGFRLVREI